METKIIKNKLNKKNKGMSICLLDLQKTLLLQKQSIIYVDIKNDYIMAKNRILELPEIPFFKIKSHYVLPKNNEIHLLK